MDVFLQNKMLMRLIAVLIIINLVSISAFLWKGVFSESKLLPNSETEDSRTPDKERSISDILKKELQLSREQAEKMQNIREEFFNKEKSLSKIIRSQRDSMNTAMYSVSTDDSLILSLAKRISENEHKMEIMRFEQSKEFKSICTREQLDKFEKLAREIKDYFKPNKPVK